LGGREIDKSKPLIWAVVRGPISSLQSAKYTVRST
jgi:hypothetical protein